ncbi:MAG: DUF4340 domain-containing protein [Acidobacteriota bacterium]
MRSLNLKLLAAAVIMMALSGWTYWNSVQQAERFERGQKFLPNLNPDEIAEIEIRQADETTALRRGPEGDRFLITSADGYRATNSSVNRFIKSVLELALEKEVGSGGSLHEELGLMAAGEEGASPETVEIALRNASGSDMVRFAVGESIEGGGTYVRRLDGDEETVFLTDRRVFLNTAEDDFVDKEILDLAQSEVQSLEGIDYRFARAEAGGPLALSDMPAGQKESSQAGQVKSVLQGLRFTQQFLANDPEIVDLVFDRQIEVLLEDGSGYVLQSAERGDRHFLRLEGFHTAGRITIAQDASDEEVQETSELLERADELQRFNAFHGSWIYEVTVNTADRVRATRDDLLEDA